MKLFSVVLSLALLSGCASSYCWKSSVPSDHRTVNVPIFRNESGLQEIGAIASRQLLREFQREGTFKIANGDDDAAVEIQGTIKSVSSSSDAYNRRAHRRYAGYIMKCQAEIAVIDKISGEVVIPMRKYTAETTYAAGNDNTTAQRDASGRVADVLARKIVNDVLRIKWNKKASCNKEQK